MQKSYEESNIIDQNANLNNLLKDILKIAEPIKQIEQLNKIVNTREPRPDQKDQIKYYVQEYKKSVDSVTSMLNQIKKEQLKIENQQYQFKFPPKIDAFIKYSYQYNDKQKKNKIDRVSDHIKLTIIDDKEQNLFKIDQRQNELIIQIKNFHINFLYDAVNYDNKKQIYSIYDMQLSFHDKIYNKNEKFQQKMTEFLKKYIFFYCQNIQPYLPSEIIKSYEELLNPEKSKCKFCTKYLKFENTDDGFLPPYIFYKQNFYHQECLIRSEC